MIYDAMKPREWLTPLAIIIVHLLGAYAGAYWLAQDQLNPISSALNTFFAQLSLSGSVFFSQLFISGCFLYALFLALWYFGVRPTSHTRAVGGAFALSFAISILLSADYGRRTASVDSNPPDSFSGLIYRLVTEHQPILALSLITLMAVLVGTYYIFRSLFSVEYTGSGIQIKLPGQTVYYMPVYPQISWQNTGISLREGEKITIELSGYVSPGALQEISELEEHMKAFVEWQDRGSKPEEWSGLPQAATWPYTGPEGYLEEWYGPTKKLEVLKSHPIYKQDYFYRKDTGLTVKGLPHNKVLGIIRAAGEPEPRKAERGQPAYDWENKDDQQRLLYLSSERYPVKIEAKKSGDLYIVINDVDEARWDNGGMFFLKLTRNAWF
jgi:hypothetical protein